MNNRTWLYVAVLGSMVGCAALPTSSTSPREPAKCTEQLPAWGVTRVYIDVAAGAGTPQVSPELCVVRSGTEVLWRTEVKVQEPFELDFAESPGAPPAQHMPGEPAQKQFRSTRTGDRQEVVIIAKPVTVASEIRYDVRIGPFRGDPGIKIMPY